jgi:NAD(P)-dependent dehydrogenase (short-subunit alcohol dehydrogenase family)
MQHPFEGKVAIVTGGNSGIGRATAVRFAAKGARVTIAARRADEGHETVEIIRAAGGEAIFVPTDVSQESQIEAMVQETIETFGGLDYAFNNAGVLGPVGSALTDVTEDAWDRVIDVNLKGVWRSMKYEIPEMLKGGGGAIVNDSSVAGLLGGGLFAYSASKHGVIGLTKSAALAYVQQGIRINAVCPGIVRTPMVERFLADPESNARFEARAPIGRLGNPEEVADAVVWLCSDEASFVAGIAMPVDGGFVAGSAPPRS